LTRCGTVRRLCPHPLLHYCQYVPLDCASGSVSGAKPCAAFHLHGKEKGWAHLSTAAAKLWPLFNFHLLFYYDMAEAPSSTFNPRARHLTRSFNFNPRRQLHPSSTSILLDNFIPRRRQRQPSSPFKFQTPSLFYFVHSP
jgi:hypothetical protein